MAHDKRVKELSYQLSEVTQQHESATHDVTELKVQMKIVEDSRDSTKRELAEASDNIRRSTRVRSKSKLNSYL